MSKEREILKALIGAVNSPRNEEAQVILEWGFGDNTVTVIIGGGHVHCGVPDGSYEQLIDDLHRCLVKDDPLTWGRYFTDPGFKKTKGAPD